jgi:Bacterial regulatory helix-turn-helix protein, lysR family
LPQPSGKFFLLELAQSTVSEAVAALERSLGAQLVVRARGGDGARLTEAGEALVPHARGILAAVDHAHAAIAGATRSARARGDRGQRIHEHLRSTRRAGGPACALANDPVLGFGCRVRERPRMRGPRVV